MTLLPVVKQIDMGSILSISHLYDLTTDSLTNEVDTQLSNITTILWGHTHSPLQWGLLYRGNYIEL